MQTLVIYNEDGTEHMRLEGALVRSDIEYEVVTSQRLDATTRMMRTGRSKIMLDFQFINGPK